MTASVRYLLGRAGGFPIAIPAEKMLHIWPEITAAPEAFKDADVIDLRAAIGQTAEQAAARAAEGEGVAVAFESEELKKLLILDAIGTFVTLSDDDFIALPDVFDLALQFFDAACRRAFNGGHPLRLRLAPQSHGD